MHGRAALRREKRICTVSMARKLERQRLKRRDNIDELVLRLKILGSPGVDVDRINVARKITACSAFQFKWHKGARSTHRFKALHWITEELFRLIRLERDPSVLIWLVRLVPALNGPLTWDFEIYTNATVYEVASDVLEQKPSLRIRIETLKMVQHQLCISRVEQASNRLARACSCLVKDFRARNGELRYKPFEMVHSYLRAGLWDEAEVHLALGSLWQFVDEIDADIISDMCRNGLFMDVVFDAIRCETRVVRKEERETSEPTNFLAHLLRHTEEADREYLRGRYAEDLRMAFMQLDAWQLNEALLHVDFAAIVATNPCMLDRVWLMVTQGSRHERHSLATRLLNYGLQTSDGELQRLLGMGFLSSAGYFADFRYPPDQNEARIFRGVLTARPEWAQYFRAITHRESPVSHTALHGATIPERPPKGVDYVVLDEDVEMI